MPHCPTCGTENAASAAFCTHCGANLASVAAPQVPALETEPAPVFPGQALGAGPAIEGEVSPSVMGAFGHCLFRNYANFSGRASRTEYWGFFLTFVLLVLIAAFVFGVLVSLDETLGLGVLILGVLGYFAMILPMLAVTIRRLHDTGRSGWWYLINFVPYVGSIVLFVFVVLPSQEQANQWGAPPRHV